LDLKFILCIVILVFFSFILFYFLWSRKKKRGEAKEEAQSIELALGKTKNAWAKARDFFKTEKISDSDLQKFEEILITSDVSIKTAQSIIEKLQNGAVLNKILLEILNKTTHTVPQCENPTVILAVGVNGVGKTTTLAKLAKYFKEQGKKVLLVAGDTFRAAAVEQLQVWSERLDILIFKKENIQSAALIYEAIQYGLKNGFDIILCDTAGRLHSKEGLMKELQKVFQSAQKSAQNTQVLNWLILDATLGQNTLRQIEEFNKTLPVTGLILTKLDGTAKGGVVLSAIDEYNLPLYFVGTGEKVTDLKPFDSRVFVSSLLDVA